MINSSMPLVSIIICVYNGEKYLERCLQSVIEQTYKNIEIIVVNDGSIDNTPHIVEAFKKQDARIVSVHTVNEGLVEARRTGIALAHGKYIQYLDCDDALINNAVELLVNRAVETQADVVVAPFFFCEDDKKHLSDIIDFDYMSGIEYLKQILNQKAYWTVWSKFHLRSLYVDDLERIQIAFGEDVVLSTQLLLRSAKVVSVNSPILDYYVYPSSMSHAFNDKVYRDFNSYVFWFEDYLSRNGLNDELAKERAAFHIKNTMMRLHWKKLKDTDKEMKRVLAELRAYPDLQTILSRREKKIVATYKLFAPLGYWRLLYYKRKGKL